MKSNYKYWDKEESEEHSQKHSIKDIAEMDLMNLTKFEQVNLNDCVLRATQSEYKISNIPATFE